MKYSQLCGVAVRKLRDLIWGKGTAGLSGDERSSVGVGCVVLHIFRLGRDIKCRTTESGSSNSTSEIVRADPHRRIKFAMARLSSGLGIALGEVERERDRRFDGDMVELMVRARGAYSSGEYSIPHPCVMQTRMSDRMGDTKGGR